MYLIQHYSPKNIDDFIINTSLKKLLNTLITLDNIKLLFIGDNSSGKTTIINLLISAYYNIHIDTRIVQQNIYKINSLNEQGITCFRPNLKTFCQTNSMIKGKKKIVIIDDMDNLNQQNQQILRNCIDKYDHKIHFIFSCVNIQKILDNIQSRITLIKLDKLDNQQLFDFFKNIISTEQIKICDDDISFIIKISNYNMNIIYNNLQKLLLLKRDIDRKDILHNCTTINFDIFEQFTKKIFNNDTIKSTNILYDLFENGYSVNDILENYFDFVKITDIIPEFDKFKYFKVICKFITYFYTIHEDKCELFLFVNQLIKTQNLI